MEDSERPINWRDFMHSASGTILSDIARDPLWIGSFVLTLSLFGLAFAFASQSRRLKYALYGDLDNPPSLPLASQVFSCKDRGVVLPYPLTTKPIVKQAFEIVYTQKKGGLSSLRPHPTRKGPEDRDPARSLMRYNFKSTIDDYIFQWSTAFYTGRTGMAENLLAAVKCHDCLGKSWEIKVAEADVFISEVGAIPSERIIHCWNEMKRELEAFLHECELHPCSICSEKAAILTIGGLITETYHDAIDQASQWIRLYEDDIIGRFLHALAWYALGKELTELSTDTVVPADAVEQPTQESTATDAVACYTRVLEDLEVATRLTQELPDDKLYFSKYLRRKASDFYEQLKQVEFTQDLDPLDIGTPKEVDMSDDDPIAIPADIFRRMLKELTARTLLALNRPQEALPMLEEGLQIARSSADETRVSTFLFILAVTLLELNRQEEALPVLEEILQAARALRDEEIIVFSLHYLSRTLLTLNRPKKPCPY